MTIEPFQPYLPEEPARRSWRREVPRQHKTSSDTRLAWLWNQRFGVVQTVYNESPDLEDRTAAVLVLKAIFGDLSSIELLFNRLEGAPMVDEDILEGKFIL